MIHNIIFDMGRVLIRWDPAYMLSCLPLSEDDRSLVLRELFQKEEWVNLDGGTMTEEEVTNIVCKRLPVRLHDTVYNLVHYWHRDFLIPIPGMGQLVSDLKQAGYHIYLLSNAGSALRSYFPRIPGSEHFDGLMVSAEEKLLKPQKEIYECLYKRFSLKPEECWFIDDHAPNIEGALLTGMRGTVFNGDSEELRCILRAEGIRC